MGCPGQSPAAAAVAAEGISGVAAAAAAAALVLSPLPSPQLCLTMGWWSQ